MKASLFHSRIDNEKRILATALVACAFTAQAQVKTGYEIETLYPVGFHHDKGDGLYIEFQAGAMPGCHGGKGGRLSKSNPNYKEYYSLLLTMMTTKSFKESSAMKIQTIQGGGVVQLKGYLFIQSNKHFSQ